MWKLDDNTIPSFKIYKKKCPYCGENNSKQEHINKCKENSPLISVIIPSRVGEEIMTLESLKKQTYENIEIITEYDEKQEGASVVRNRGAEKAKGKYLFFCDNDLVLNPNCISDLYLTLKANPQAKWAFGKFYIDNTLCNEGKDLKIPEKGTVDWINYFHRMSTMSLIDASIKPRFDESMKKYNDWDLWLTLNSQGYQPAFCDNVLFYTYNRKNGISVPDKGKRIKWTNRLYEKHNVFVFQEVLDKNRKISDLSREIKVIKSSKFWKMRNLYVKYKNKLIFGIFHPISFLKKYLIGKKNYGKK